MLTLLSQNPDTWDQAVNQHHRKLKELETAEAYADALTQAGWTEGWADEDVAKLRARIAGAWQRTPRHLYVYTALSDVSVDTEGFDADDEYAETVHELASATRGGFAPTEVTQETSEGEPPEVTLAFVLGGARHEVTFEQADDWCKNEALELIDKALAQAEVAERFIALPTADQILSAAFVRPEAFQRALEQHLVPNAAVVL